MAPLIQDLGWTDLQIRSKNFRLTSLYKILNGLIAVPVSDLLTPADEITRGEHKQSFKHIIANTTLGQNSFLYKTVPDWNHFPLHGRFSIGASNTWDIWVRFLNNFLNLFTYVTTTFVSHNVL